MAQKMMDAIVKPVAGPGLELRQVPVPTPGPGEVLITESLEDPQRLELAWRLLRG